MKLFIALVISIGLEYATKTDLSTEIANTVISLGYPANHGDVLSILPIATLKASLITLFLLHKNNKLENILILILSLFAIIDCVMLTLFLNNALYDILSSVKSGFDIMYRAFEIFCIFTNVICVGRFLLSNNSNVSSDSTGRGGVGGQV